tara:strand:+ start:387 stop:890 length:504 start_codon:yes stop_codon:yes gene_type:complete
MKTFKELFLEMSGTALGKASDDFKSRSNDMTQGRQFSYLAGLMKNRNHSQLKKDLNGFISRNRGMKDIIVKVLSKHLKPFDVKSLVEDIEITDKTGKAYNFAKEYIDTYKDSFRPVPDIITKGGNIRKFILKGPDEKFVADMLTGPQGKRSRFNALRNLNIKQRKVK